MDKAALHTNDNFDRLLAELVQTGEDSTSLPTADPLYQRFIERFPANGLLHISLTEYCVGKGDGESFCWWIERGLEPLLGRYMPGTARGHMLYFQKDGTVYKNRHLRALSDADALSYTLRVQACVAQADMSADLSWIDDDQLLYRRAGVEPRVTVGNGRKLRLLSCYHPEDALPISSSAHLGHFLQVLGSPETELPSKQRPVARMLLLREYLRLAQKTLPELTAIGFMRGLYKPELGLAPVEEDEDDEVNSNEEITVRLSGGAVRNGYVKIPKEQTLFSHDCIAENEQATSQKFVLELPDGTEIETCLIANRGRIQARFNSLFSRLQVKEGDRARIQKTEERRFVMSIEGQDPIDLPASGPVASSIGLTQASEPPLNQILYGPPGTGKTFSTVNAALEVLDPLYLDEHREDRSALKERFDTLMQEHRIRFLTFHQSFSYEDFVEGLRATTNEDTGQIRYEVVDGIFKSLCEAAGSRVTRPQDVAQSAVHEPDAATKPFELSGRRIWKMSLGNTLLASDSNLFDECVQGGFALLGYGGAVDFSGARGREDVVQRFQASGRTIANPQTDYAVKSVTDFVTRMKSGDLLIISDGNTKFRAVGEVTGEYWYRAHNDFIDDFAQARPVRWLRTYEPSLPLNELMSSQFSQRTLYELRLDAAARAKLQRLLNDTAVAKAAGSALQVGPVGSSGYRITQVTNDMVELAKPNENRLHLALSMLRTLAYEVDKGTISLEDIRSKNAVDRLPGRGLEPYIVNGYSNIVAPLVAKLVADSLRPTVSAASEQQDARVLIIDEINRGNISRIFGELITLIEPSKRSGASEALEVVLPYSKQPFSVPSNVYLIGTMNTADRSLTGMDVALRRRFVFKAMPPQPELLTHVIVDGIPVGQLLAVMNQRIEALLDRDHCLGHAYFMPLKDKRQLPVLAEIFRNQVLPLLQEYFFDDWERIQWILNDHRKPAAYQFVSARVLSVDELFGSDVNVTRTPRSWQVNRNAFMRSESYLGVIDHRVARDEE